MAKLSDVFLVLGILILVIFVVIVLRCRNDASVQPMPKFIKKFSSGKRRLSRSERKKYLAKAENLRYYVGHGSGHMTCPQNCTCDTCKSNPTCKKGGLAYECDTNEDCACGLACQGGRCVCPKPPPPQLHIQSFASSITVTWSPVTGADYYDVYLFDSNAIAYGVHLFFTNTVITFSNLPPQTYYAIVFSGSNMCGSLQQFSQTGEIGIGGCEISADCPGQQICSNQTCVECVQNSNCPDGNVCENNICVPGCDVNADCPPNQFCVNGTCQFECQNNQDCPLGNLCQGNECVPGCIFNTDCPQGSSCINGQCGGQTCSSDFDCPIGPVAYMCIQEQCIPVTPCQTNQDCPQGEICQQGNCIPCPTGIPTITAFTGTFNGGSCFNYTYFASWTAIVGATSYDLIVTQYQQGNPVNTVNINGVTSTSITNGDLFNAIQSGLCSGFDVYINVRFNGPCGPGQYSAPYQIGGQGAACC